MFSDRVMMKNHLNRIKLCWVRKNLNTLKNEELILIKIFKKCRITIIFSGCFSVILTLLMCIRCCILGIQLCWMGKNIKISRLVYQRNIKISMMCMVNMTGQVLVTLVETNRQRLWTAPYFQKEWSNMITKCQRYRFSLKAVITFKTNLYTGSVLRSCMWK